MRPSIRAFLAAVFATTGALGCGDAAFGTARVLATDGIGIRSLAVDDFYVYWSTTSGSVKRVVRDGGDAETIATGQDLPSHLTVDRYGDHVYWTTGDNLVVRAPKDGSAERTIVHVQEAELQGLSVDDSHIYWTAGNGGAGTLERAAKADLLRETVVSDIQNPRAVQATGTRVLWLDQGPQADSEADEGTIMFVTTEGSSPAAMVANLRQPPSFYASSSHLFWTSLSDDTVSWRATDDGGSEERSVISGHGGLHDVVADDTSVYWTSTDGSLSAAEIDGGDPVDRISGPAGLVSIALDETSVYWANSNDVAVMVMPK